MNEGIWIPGEKRINKKCSSLSACIWATHRGLEDQNSNSWNSFKQKKSNHLFVKAQLWDSGISILTVFLLHSNSTFFLEFVFGWWQIKITAIWVHSKHRDLQDGAAYLRTKQEPGKEQRQRWKNTTWEVSHESRTFCHRRQNRTCHVSKLKSWHYRCMHCIRSWWLLYLFSPYIEETLKFVVISQTTYILHIHWISMYSLVQILSIFFIDMCCKMAGNCTWVSRSQSLPWMADSGQSCLNRRWGFDGMVESQCVRSTSLGTLQKKCHSIYIYKYIHVDYMWDWLSIVCCFVDVLHCMCSCSMCLFYTSLICSWRKWNWSSMNRRTQWWFGCGRCRNGGSLVVFSRFHKAKIPMGFMVFLQATMFWCCFFVVLQNQRGCL